MAIGPFEINGMITGDLVDVPARRQFFSLPQGFIPAGTEDPFCGLGGFNPLADPVAKFIE